MAKQDINLDSFSAQELVKLIEDAQSKLEAKKEDAKAALLEEMTSKAAELGLNLDALLASPKPRTNVRKPRSDKGTPMEAKFRGPNGEEWTGRGRKPRWVSAAEADGENIQKYRVAA